MQARNCYPAMLATAMTLCLAACGPNGLFGQSKEDFESNAMTALVDVCASEAIPGLKVHLLADWTEAQIIERGRAASASAAASFQKMEWTHGVTQAEFNELMDAARTQGRVLMLQVGVQSYPDSLDDTVAEIAKSCTPEATGLMQGIEGKLSF
jgi:hypothetical protein